MSLSTPELCALATMAFGLVKPVLALARLVMDRRELMPVETLLEERRPRPEPPALPEHTGGYRTSARRT